MLRFAFSKTRVALSLSRAAVLRAKKAPRGTLSPSPAGRPAGNVGRKGSRAAVPAGVPPPRALGGIQRRSRAAAAGGQDDGVSKHYEKLQHQLQDFFDDSTLSERDPNSKEKSEIKRLARKINKQLSAEEVEDMVDTAQTRGNWKSALLAAERDGNFIVAKAVEKFANFRFGIRNLPPAGAKRAEVENLVVDFLRKSLFASTLAGRLERRLLDPDLAVLANRFPCPIICKPSNAETFDLTWGVVEEVGTREEVRRFYTPPLKKAARQVKDRAATEKAAHRSELPLVIGGESGSGKSIFSALAPQYILEGRGETAGMKKNCLTVYVMARDINPTDLRRVKKLDDQVQRAKTQTGKNGPRKKRTEAAAKCLRGMVCDAIECPGELVLPSDKKYKHLFLVVDELSSSPEFFRALLVHHSLQEKLLSFAGGLAEHVHLICCATGSHSVIVESGSQPSEYNAISMGPSAVLFAELMTRGGASETTVQMLARSPVLPPMVENRRIGAFATQALLETDGSFLKLPVGKYGMKTKWLRLGGSGGGMLGFASVIAFQVAQEYRRTNALSGYSGEAATIATLEGLRRLLMWDPNKRTDAERIFDSMGGSSPLRLGTFATKYADLPPQNGTAQEKVTVSVSRAQILLAAIRYGSEPSAVLHIPDSSEELSAYLFCVFLDAVREVPAWTMDKETEKKVQSAVGQEEREKIERDARLNYVHKNKNNESFTDLDNFAAALRGRDTAATITLGGFLHSLDQCWQIPQTASMRGKLKHARCAPLLFSEKQIQSAGNTARLLEELSTTIDSFCKELFPATRRKKVAFTVMNAPQASYADFIIVAGDYLFLGQSTLYKDGGSGSKSVTDAQNVKVKLIKMGFKTSYPATRSVKEVKNVNRKHTEELNKYRNNISFTKKLMKKFGCKVAVPLFFVSEPIKADAIGRTVVAEGHGWKGPAPFIHMPSRMEKSCTRDKKE